MLSPKHSAKHAWRTGTSALSTARAVTSYEMIRQRTRSTSSQFLTSSLFRTFTSGKVDHTVTDTERKKVINNITLRINSKRSERNELGRTEEVIREMDKLANEDHTHIATEKELNVYRSNWWIRSNFVGSDTMPIRHRPDQLCVASRMQRIKLITKIGGKALPRLGGNGKIPGCMLHLRHHRDDGLDTDRTGKPAKICESSIYLWNESQNEFGAKVTVTKFGNSQRSSLSPTGWCKEFSSYYRKTGYGNTTNTARKTTRALRTSMRQTTSTTSTMT